MDILCQRPGPNSAANRSSDTPASGQFSGYLGGSASPDTATSGRSASSAASVWTSQPRLVRHVSAYRSSRSLSLESLAARTDPWKSWK